MNPLIFMSFSRPLRSTPAIPAVIDTIKINATIPTHNGIFSTSQYILYKFYLSNKIVYAGKVAVPFSNVAASSPV